MNRRQKESSFTQPKHRLLIGMALVMLTVMVVFIYFPGLSGPYVLDDDENIAKNKAVAIVELSETDLWRAMQSNDSGLFKRPLATLSFALNYYFSGGFDNTFPFKLTNLIIHIINSVLLLFLAQKILRVAGPGRHLTPTEQVCTALLATTLWAVHPIQLTNVLYVVQRMNSMAALFVILGLIGFIQGRQQLASSMPKGLTLMGTGILFGTLLGMGCKENAVLLPLFALVIEYSFFGQEDLDEKRRTLLGYFYLVILAVPLLAFFGYLYINPDFLTEAYKVRHFSMMERVLTETRVLWNYIYLILLPSTHALGLFHDDILISKGLFTPPVTLLATCGLVTIVSVAFVKKIPVVSFAILWFLAGHVLESTVFGLEVAYEHRNYLPTFGIVFALAYLYVQVSKHWNPDLRFIVAIVIVLTLGFATWSLANAWRDIYSLAETNVTNHPDSLRANEFAARVNATEKGDLVAAIRYSIKAEEVSPDEAGVHIDLRLWLAMLSSEIDQDARSTNLKKMKGANIQIAGLPPEIVVTTSNHKIQVIYPPSTNKVIEDLLRTRPITIHTLASLTNLGRCIVEKPDICQQLADQGLRWFAIAADNPVTIKVYHTIILNNTAELHEHRSDYTTALTYIDRATRVSPDVLFYRLKKTQYLIKLGRLDEAKSLLANIDNLDPERDIRYFNNSATIKYVRDMYAEAVKNQRGASAHQDRRL